MITTITHNDARCHSCHQPIAKGEQADWSNARMQLRHIACEQRRQNARNHFNRSYAPRPAARSNHRSIDEMHDIVAGGYGAAYGRGDLD